MNNRLALTVAAATLAGLATFGTHASADTLRYQQTGQHGTEFSEEYTGEEIYDRQYSLHDNGIGAGGYNPNSRHGYRQSGHRQHERVCQPGQAIEKARAFGLRRPGIERVTPYEIVVSGRYYGNRAWLVIDRQSRRCRVIDSRGI